MGQDGRRTAEAPGGKGSRKERLRDWEARVSGSPSTFPARPLCPLARLPAEAGSTASLTTRRLMLTRKPQPPR